MTFDPEKWAVYALHTSINQDNVAAQAVNCYVTVPEGEIMIPLYAELSTGTVAGARTAQVFIVDTSNVTLCRLGIQAINTGEEFYLNFAPDAMGVNNDVGIPRNCIIGGGDKLLFTCLAMAQNEDFVVKLRCLISGKKPTVQYGTDDTETETYNEVI